MKTTIALLLLLCIGCATSTKELYKLNVGMTKGDVINVLGEPDGMKAAGNQQIFVYLMYDGTNIINQEYWVRFTDNKLDRFGRPSDFR